MSGCGGGGVVAEGVGVGGGREVVVAAPGDVDVGRRGPAIGEAEEVVVVEGSEIEIEI